MTTLRITGMTCDHCARGIETALNTLPGVKAHVSYENALAQIEAGSDIKAELLITAVTAKGYGASIGDDTTPALKTSRDAGLRVAIIGTGSAAFAAAIRAAENGARVTLIEAGDVIGETCVNVGCVPSKILIRAAQLRRHAAHHALDGLARHALTLDNAARVAQQQARVEELRRAKYEAFSNPTRTSIWYAGGLALPTPRP